MRACLEIERNLAAGAKLSAVTESNPLPRTFLIRKPEFSGLTANSLSSGRPLLRGQRLIVYFDLI